MIMKGRVLGSLLVLVLLVACGGGSSSSPSSPTAPPTPPPEPRFYMDAAMLNNWTGMHLDRGWVTFKLTEATGIGATVNNTWVWCEDAAGTKSGIDSNFPPMAIGPNQSTEVLLAGPFNGSFAARNLSACFRLLGTGQNGAAFDKQFCVALTSSGNEPTGQRF